MEAIPERPELDVGESMQERKKAKDQEWANWGSNPTSKTIEERKKVVKIACGENFVLALRASGEVWACSVMQQTPGPWIYVSDSPCTRMSPDRN
jgi:alpha-tubulin suppressor-like RCC1 family protein